MLRALKYVNLVFFILMIIINALANTMPLGYGNTGDISAKYPNLFTPAPITFSIWGVIYLLVAFFISYQFDLFSDQRFANALTDLIGPWFIISCLMNIGWIFSWHFDLTGLSMVFMVGLLLTLTIITTDISPAAVINMADTNSMPFAAKLCTYAFDIYLGWIVAATIANFSVLLVKVKWNRFGLSEEFWTIIILLIGAAIGALFILTNQRYMSALAIIWAYCGILIKHISPEGYGASYPRIIITAFIGIFIILAAGIIQVTTGARTS